MHVSKHGHVSITEESNLEYIHACGSPSFCSAPSRHPKPWDITNVGKRKNTHVYIYIYLHVYIIANIYIYNYIYINIYIHIYIYLYIYIFIFTYIYIYIYTFIDIYIYIFIFTNIYKYIYIFVEVSINRCTRIWIVLMEDPIKMDDLEVPLFQEASNTYTHFQFTRAISWGPGFWFASFFGDFIGISCSMGIGTSLGKSKSLVSNSWAIAIGNVGKLYSFFSSWGVAGPASPWKMAWWKSN